MRRIAVALAVLLLAAAAVAVQRVGGSDAAQTAARAPAPVVSWRDASGMSLSYPRGWSVVEEDREDVRLLVRGGRARSLLVRRTPLGSAAPPARLARRVRREIVRAPGVQLLGRPRAVRVSGLSGYRYLYLYEDRALGRRGLHAHYVLFGGDTMTSLVFQDAPVASFRRSAPVFDRVLSSFRAAG